MAEALRLLQHLLAVGHQDVAPGLRVAGRDAREVAKTRAGQRQEVPTRRLVDHRAEVREGQQVRQVADGGKGGVMILGRHVQHLGADGRPDIDCLLRQGGVCLRQRRQDDLAFAVEVRAGVLDARRFLAGDGVRGHEAGQVLAQHAACRIDDVALGAAHVHQQHVGRQQVADRLERGFGGRHGHGQQHDVRPRHGLQGGLCSHVDDAELACALGGGRRLAVADHALDQTGVLQRQRERAAHQAAADQTELVEHQQRSIAVISRLWDRSRGL